MKLRNVGVTVDPKTLKNLKAEAKRKRLTLSELARRKLQTATEPDDHIQKFAEEFSRRVGVSVPEFFEVLAYDFISRYEAECEIFGAPVFTMMPFFKDPDGSQPLGMQLYRYLKAAHASQCRHHLQERLREREAAGEELSERERTFMIDYRVGAAWISSPKFQDERQALESFVKLGRWAREKMLVPEGIEITDLELGKLYQRVVDGEISGKELAEELNNSFYRAEYGKDRR